MRGKRPVILHTMSLNEYIMVFKYIMAETKHIRSMGFVNTPLLFETLDNTRLESLTREALEHKTLINTEKGIAINDIVITFIQNWIKSKDIIALKKPSFAESKGIFFTNVEGVYLAIKQDAEKDEALLIADSNIKKVYNQLREEIEKHDLGTLNKLKFSDKVSDKYSGEVPLKVTPVSRVFLQCFDNNSGKKYEVDELIHIGKKQLEIIQVDDTHKVLDFRRGKNKTLGKIIIQYIEKNCCSDLDNYARAKDLEKEDPEYYTRFSFKRLTQDQKFPKELFGFIKLIILNIIKGFTNWKNLLKTLAITAVMSLAVFLWNIFALCYLNDTFYIKIQSIFGKSTPYLLAGRADASGVIGLPGFVDTINTVTITAVLYYLLAIAVRTFISDIASGKLKSNFSYFLSFRRDIKRCEKATSKKIDFYVWQELALAVLLNLFIFNPYAVFLLSVMLLISCMKYENGGIAPLLMMLNASFRYQKVAQGQQKPPIFGGFQLRLLGLSIGLFLCSALNLCLWFTVDFNFEIRLILSAILIILSFIKIGIIKVNKSITTVILVCCTAFIIIAILARYGEISVLADDGGWTESGSSIIGLIQNLGWPTVVAYSLVLAVAVGIGCATAGLGTAAIAVASGTMFGISALYTTFSEEGREEAYDFIWGGFSPYGGDNKNAGLLRFTLSFVPGLGTALNYTTGVRDSFYAAEMGDWETAIFGIVTLFPRLGEVESDASMEQYPDYVYNAEDYHYVDEFQNPLNSDLDKIVDSVGEDKLSEDYLTTINQSIKDLSQRNVFTADDEASNALLEVGENAGYSRGVIEKYIEKLEVDIDYEKTERARKMWGDGWDTLSPENQDVLKDVCTNRMNAAESLVKKKLNGIKTIVEFKNRYDNGIFDSTYSLDDILKLKMEKAASPKLYSGISNSSYLLRADEFISDQAVVQYIKDLCPNNSNISNCNNLQEIANELASHPVEVELVHFQNAAKDANNIYFHNGNFGNPNNSLVSGGGVFSVPESSLEHYATQYSNICSYENGTFSISDFEKFGQEVLSGAKFKQNEGVYMIKTLVPLKDGYVSMPSVNSPSAYMDQFVSGGRLLSGEIEVTQRPLPDIISNAIATGANELSGIKEGVSYKIIDLR